MKRNELLFKNNLIDYKQKDEKDNQFSIENDLCQSLYYFLRSLNNLKEKNIGRMQTYVKNM